MPNAEFESLSLPITGMSCVSCAARLEKALLAVDGVVSAEVNFASEAAQVRRRPALPLQDLIQAVRGAGYGVDTVTRTLALNGMSCAACAARIEKALSKVPGVVSAVVNFATETATVESLSIVAPGALQAAIERVGYEVVSAAPSEPSGQGTVPESWWVAAGLLLTLPLLLPMVPMLWDPQGHAWMLPGWLQWLLATPVQWVLGARFYRGVWKALRNGSANMDVLVSIGTSAAYGLSCYGLWAHGLQGHGHLYFEASAAVISLVRLGKWLESRAKRQTTDALRALGALRPTHAMVQRESAEVSLPIEQVRMGDRVVVRPGERIAVDGQVLEGSSHVDEALITGESLPVAKSPGDRVTGGAINGEGVLLVETRAIGAETVLAQIIRWVETAQAAKAPIQRQVDRVSEIFVPVVLVLAALTLLGWRLHGESWELAVIQAVSVLVIACPCALGLATPTAVMVGTGVAARRGILIKDAEALELAHSITTVVFDKTGTLTLGHPTLVAAHAAPNQTEADLLAWAASLQRGSQHPLALATLESAQTRGLALHNVADAQALPGRGLKGSIDGRVFWLGSSRLLNEMGIDPGPLKEMSDRHQQQGCTVSWLLSGPVGAEAGHELIGLLAFGDPVKPAAAQAMAELRAAGIKTVLLTGDNRGAAEAVARTLGIDRVHAEVLPADKAAVIQSLKAQGEVVAMVGDGINDAPALTEANIGMAMSSGTDVAMASAGITLMRADLRLVHEAIQISRRTVAKIRQNLGWAFVYNLLGIPLAALGALSPVVAGAAMALSSVSVVANALLLRRFRIHSASRYHSNNRS